MLKWGVGCDVYPGSRSTFKGLKSGLRVVLYVGIAHGILGRWALVVQEFMGAAVLRTLGLRFPKAFFWV